MTLQGARENCHLKRINPCMISKLAHSKPLSMSSIPPYIFYAPIFPRNFYEALVDYTSIICII